MALGDTYFVKLQYKVIERSTGNTVQNWTNFTYFIPYFSNTNRPATGVIVNMGFVTSLYYDYINFCPYFNIPSYFASNLLNLSFDNFLNYFPNLIYCKPYQTDYIIVLKNPDNGHIMVADTGRSHFPIYASETDFENGFVPPGTYNDMYAQINRNNTFVTFANQNGSGSTLGQNELRYYSQIDINERISYFMRVELRGVNSTTNTINVYAISEFAIDSNDVYFLGDSIKPLDIHADPYAGDGTSSTGGGGGAYTYPYDIIDVPEYDDADSIKRQYANRGFVEVWNPSMSELISLHTYLFSSGGISDTFLNISRMLRSPLDAVVSLSMIPYKPTVSDTAEHIYFGSLDSNIESHKISSQFLTIDWGTLDVEKATRSFNDFTPYSKAEIYLPYIGIREIDIDLIMGYQIGLKYYVDVVSGDFVAFLYLNGAIDAGTPEYESMIDGGLQSGVIYQWAGNCALHVPISGVDYSSLLSGSLGLIGTAAGMAAGIATGGLTAAGAVSGVVGAVGSGIAAGKNPVQRSGSIPSTTGWLSIQTPYLILSRPRLSIPEENNAFVGYPTNVTFTLGDVTGYTEIEKIHLENIPATGDELSELETILKNGVIL